IKLLQLAAKISRELYDAEKNQLNLLRGISILDAEYTKIKIKQEKRRYQRQKETIKRIMKCDAFIDMLPIKKISDIFWAFTGRDRLIDQLLRD
ncbi:MAG: hypothetical protein JO131_10425, partial [Gammaproteobacteria bacterium]|nr:hypothetical protein [Gammaproteobacteria bacterium]